MPTKTRRPRRYLTISETVDVDVNIDDIADALIEDGWTPPAEYRTDGPTVDGTTILDAEQAGELAEVRAALLAHHDAAHGITDWPTCPHTPCAALPIDYRSHPTI